jgi:hypothetical protein
MKAIKYILWIKVTNTSRDKQFAYRFGIEYTEAVKLNQVLNNKNKRCKQNANLRSEF